VLAQSAAAVFVLGSYAAAEGLRKRRRARRFTVPTPVPEAYFG
jgi:hypothetical protein